MNRERIEQTLAAALDRHRARAERLIAERVRAELLAFHRRHPRRRVHFLDAMGSVCVWVDEREEKDTTHRDPRLARVFAPLRSLVEWYCDVSDAHGIAIADVILDPVPKRDTHGGQT